MTASTHGAVLPELFLNRGSTSILTPHGFCFQKTFTGECSINWLAMI